MTCVNKNGNTGTEIMKIDSVSSSLGLLPSIKKNIKIKSILG